MLQRLPARERHVYLPQEAAILIEDADDELLALLARDRGGYVHYGRGYFIGPDAWWTLEQRSNPLPYRLYSEARRQAHEAYLAGEEARKAAAREVATLRRERERAEREQQWAEIERRNVEFVQTARTQWVDMLERAVAECRGTGYDSLVADLERDAATIRGWPVGELPGHIDQMAFTAELARRMRWIDANAT